ncbi:MAG TPA: aminoglycoside phosphotransferase family protein [Candidatus Dormibacteraeota bacterium]|nr:aminoglycoside phosphotransferase family protein [Candidatus Dormibacteraeota bacterium]
MPEAVRNELEARLGSPVVEAITQPAGFSPGVAARLRLRDGSRAFVKAVSEEANPDSHHIYRQEARIAASLPASVPTPRFRWLYDHRGWVALCFDDVGGRHPYEPWTEADLALVVAALRRLSAALTPSPIAVEATARHAFERTINGWRAALDRGEDRLDPWASRHLVHLAELEARAPHVVGGETLLHFDTRADNILIAGEEVYVVDWPWARLGAAWVDWAAMAPSVAMQGGPEPEDFMRRFELRGVPPESIDAVVCSLAGYFCVHSLDPPPPGIPTVRAFQAAQGVVALRWLRERVGWQ